MNAAMVVAEGSLVGTFGKGASAVRLFVKAWPRATEAMAGTYYAVFTMAGKERCQDVAGFAESELVYYRLVWDGESKAVVPNKSPPKGRFEVPHELLRGYYVRATLIEAGKPYVGARSAEEAVQAAEHFARQWCEARAGTR